MNTGFRGPSIPFRSTHHLIQSVLSQLNFSFYRHQPIRADFSGGQITSDAGLLPLRAFDQRHGLTRELPAQRPASNWARAALQLALLRQRVYQIVAGYEDANDADRLRYDPTLQILADQKLWAALSSQPTLSRWENAPSARDLVCATTGCASIRSPLRKAGPPAWRNPARSRFHRRSHLRTTTTELLQWRLRPAHVSSPVDLRAAYRLSAGSASAPWYRLQSCSHRAFAGAHPASSAVRFSRGQIKLRGDAGFALPVLYKFCEFFGIQYAIGIPANCVSNSRPTAA